MLNVIHICHRCEHRQETCRGKCACTIDGTDITEHAEKYDCPKNKFPSRGLGDTVAKALHAVGIDKAVKAIAGEDCGCPERQKRLNELIPFN